MINCFYRGLTFSHVSSILFYSEAKLLTNFMSPTVKDIGIKQIVSRILAMILNSPDRQNIFNGLNSSRGTIELLAIVKKSLDRAIFLIYFYT